MDISLRGLGTTTVVSGVDEAVQTFLMEFIKIQRFNKYSTINRIRETIENRSLLFQCILSDMFYARAAANKKLSDIFIERLEVVDYSISDDELVVGCDLTLSDDTNIGCIFRVSVPKSQITEA